MVNDAEYYDEAYEPTDPKHPGFVDMWLDFIDQQRKAEKENGPARTDEQGDPEAPERD